MNILIDVNHPSHVHFFRNFIKLMGSRGHSLLVTSSDSDILVELLRNYKINHIVLGNYGKSTISKIANIPIMDLKLFFRARKFSPDILLGLGSIRASHAALMFGKPCIIFEDAEHTKWQNWLYRPFASHIITNNSFKDDYGLKHMRYKGFDELAYLHPNYFTPNRTVLEELDLNNEKFILLRFVSWNTSHDYGQSGFNFKNEAECKSFIEALEDLNCRILVSTENRRFPLLSRYSIKLAPEKIHDILFFAHMYIGEGATMAAEAALLGTPSIYVSSIPLGYLDSLCHSYGLVCNCHGYKDALDKAKNLLNDINLKEKWNHKKEMLISESDDINQYTARLVEDVFNEYGD